MNPPCSTNLENVDVRQLHQRVERSGVWFDDDGVSRLFSGRTTLESTQSS